MLTHLKVCSLVGSYACGIHSTNNNSSFHKPRFTFHLENGGEYPFCQSHRLIFEVKSDSEYAVIKC